MRSKIPSVKVVFGKEYQLCASWIWEVRREGEAKGQKSISYWMGLFIDAKATATLKGYKYSGSDLSLTYKYILSPLAQKCVDLVSSCAPQAAMKG